MVAYGPDMKVLLVYPPKKVRGLNYMSPPVYSLGLLSIAAVLEREGVEVRILDAYAEGLTYPRIRRRIGSERPDVIGVTATTPTAGSALRVARLAKDVFP